jgi:hypothetical protein
MVGAAEAISDQEVVGKKASQLDAFELPTVGYGFDKESARKWSARATLHSLRTVFRRERINHTAFATALLLGHAVVARTGKSPRMEGYVGWGPQVTARWDKQGNAVRRDFAELLRHIIGNPFRLYSTPHSWPPTVVQLAQALYDGEDCRLPLSDALEEADHLELAEHFRGEEWHPKGCWVTDLVLGNM